MTRCKKEPCRNMPTKNEFCDQHTELGVVVEKKEPVLVDAPVLVEEPESSGITLTRDDLVEDEPPTLQKEEEPVLTPQQKAARTRAANKAAKLVALKKELEELAAADEDEEEDPVAEKDTKDDPEP